MDPADQFAFEGLDPANHFTMDRLNMMVATKFYNRWKTLAVRTLSRHHD